MQKLTHPFPNQAVINLVSQYAHSDGLILDVGCHSGLIGQAVKQQTGCPVWGIDCSFSAIRLARKKLDKAIAGDITQNRIRLPRHRFQIIILSNILEHLAYPQPTLIRLKRYLKKGGYIVIAVPNIAFYSMRWCIFTGRFEYQSFGILAEDHLRFFTLKSARRMIAAAGLKVIEQQTNYTGWRAVIARRWPTLLASQFVFVCRNQ